LNNQLPPNGNALQESRKKRTPVLDSVRKRRAGSLVRINLAPLMGRRDAVLCAAEVLLRTAENGEPENRETLYFYLKELFYAAYHNTGRISGMFNNSDTAAREQRLTMHIGILSKLAEAIDDFCALKGRMHEAAALYANDPGNEFDPECTARINQRLSIVEKNLFDQLCEYYNRVRARIARYRQYAVKNFSKELLERYEKSYSSVINRCNEAFEEQFSIKISTPKHEVYSR
jgi:hypothetical protein